MNRAQGDRRPAMAPVCTWAAVLLAALAAACGSDDKPVNADGGADASVATPGADPAAVNAACADRAARFCARFRECDPAGLARSYSTGSEDAECVRDHVSSCTAQLIVADTAITPADVTACGAALSSLSCDGWFGPEPEACLVRPGKRANGTPCSDWEQCQSLRCEQSAGGCGVCRPRLRGPAEGQPCDRGACDYGLSCAEDTCIARGAVGAACTDSSDCAARLRCLAGKCAAPLAEGAACATEEAQCGYQLSCEGAGQEGTCQARTAANAGEPCDDKAVFCKAGLYCRSGACAAQAGLGEACVTNAGCLTFTCAAGKCARNDRGTCRADGPKPRMAQCGICEATSDCVAGLTCGTVNGFAPGVGFCVRPGTTTSCTYAPNAPDLAHNWWWNYRVTIPVSGTGAPSTGQPPSGGTPDAAPPPRPDAGAGPDATTPPSSGGPVPPAPPICAAFAEAECAKRSACAPVGGSTLTDAHCRDRVAHWCATFLVGQPDAGWTDAAMAACAAGIKAASCAEWNGAGSELPACQVRGPRPDGAGAFTASQCASGAIRRAHFSSCGFCQPIAAAGGACVSDAECPAEHRCAANHTCRPVVAEGQACGPEAPCQGALRCVNGSCAKPGGVGAPCAATADCDRMAGAACNSTTKTCVGTVAADTCGTQNPDGNVTVCRKGFTCNSATGACIPAAADGAACVIEGDGPRCVPPAVCSAGRCVLPTATSCPLMRDPAGYPRNMDPWCRTTAYPVYCPPRGDQAASCWQAAATCATVTNCAGTGRSCASADRAYDCARNTCVPACTIPPPGNACDTCAATKCCGSLAACRADATCTSAGVPSGLYAAVDVCVKKFCPAECSAAAPTIR